MIFELYNKGGKRLVYTYQSETHKNSDWDLDIRISGANRWKTAIKTQ